MSEFDQVAHGLAPNIFGFSVTVEWNRDDKGERVTVRNAEGEVTHTFTSGDGIMRYGMDGEPDLDGTVLGVLKSEHRGIEGEWWKHPETVIWELADHDDLEWFEPTELDRETRKRIGAY